MYAKMESCKNKARQPRRGSIAQLSTSYRNQYERVGHNKVSANGRRLRSLQCLKWALLNRWLKSGFWQFHWGNLDIQLAAVRDASRWPIHAVLSTVKYAAGAVARIESSVMTVTRFRVSVF